MCPDLRGMRDEKEEIGEMGEGRSKREGKEARGKGDLGRKNGKAERPL